MAQWWFFVQPLKRLRLTPKDAEEISKRLTDPYGGRPFELKELLAKSIPNGFGVRDPKAIKITDRDAMKAVNPKTLIEIHKDEKPVVTVCVREYDPSIVFHALPKHEQLARQLSERVSESAGLRAHKPSVIVTETLPTQVMTTKQAAKFSGKGTASAIRRMTVREI